MKSSENLWLSDVLEGWRVKKWSIWLKWVHINQQDTPVKPAYKKICKCDCVNACMINLESKASSKIVYVIYDFCISGSSHE